MNIKKLDYQDKCFNKDRIKFQERMVNLNAWQCCHNCIHWDGKCKLFNAVPPSRTIVLGCEEFQYEIPF